MELLRGLLLALLLAVGGVGFLYLYSLTPPVQKICHCDEYGVESRVIRVGAETITIKEMLSGAERTVQNISTRTIEPVRVGDVAISYRRVSGNKDSVDWAILPMHQAATNAPTSHM